MSKSTSKNRIDRARYDQVMFSRVCPGCGNYIIVDVARRSNKDALERVSLYLGTFHCCGGPNAHYCWHMNVIDPNKQEKQLYETFGPRATRKRPVKFEPTTV